MNPHRPYQVTYFSWFFQVRYPPSPHEIRYSPSPYQPFFFPWPRQVRHFPTFVKLVILPEFIRLYIFLGFIKFKNFFWQMFSDIACGPIGLGTMFVLSKFYTFMGLIMLNTLRRILLSFALLCFLLFLAFIGRTYFSAYKGRFHPFFHQIRCRPICINLK